MIYMLKTLMGHTETDNFRKDIETVRKKANLLPPKINITERN